MFIDFEDPWEHYELGVYVGFYVTCYYTHGQCVFLGLSI